MPRPVGDRIQVYLYIYIGSGQGEGGAYRTLKLRHTVNGLMEYTLESVFVQNACLYILPMLKG